MDEEVRVNGASSLVKYRHLVSDQPPPQEVYITPRDKTLELLATIVALLEDIRDENRRQRTANAPRSNKASEWLQATLEIHPDGLEWATLSQMAEADGITERTLRGCRNRVASWVRDGTNRKVFWIPRSET